MKPSERPQHLCDRQSWVEFSGLLTPKSELIFFFSFFPSFLSVFTRKAGSTALMYNLHKVYSRCAMLSCFTGVWLWDSINCSPSGSSVHRNMQEYCSSMQEYCRGLPCLPQGIFQTQVGPRLLLLLHCQLVSLPLVPPINMKAAGMITVCYTLQCISVVAKA